METKKVIEQKDRGDIEIRYDIDYHEIELEQDYPIGRNDLIYIEKSKATEVAKAIDPKYQETIDMNAKLLEVLNTLYSELKDENNVYDRHLKIISEVIQQSETK